MMTRVRRNRPVPAKVDYNKIEALMNSISARQETLAEETKELNSETARLLELMQKGKVQSHVCDHLIAELFRSAGRGTNVIDPKMFHKAVGDKDFYASVSVSVTAAKKLLAEKQLAPMTANIPAKPGAEQVRVARRGS